MSKEVDTKLEKHNLRKTTVRRAVLSSFFSAKGKAISSNDLEQEISEIDRITLYRTLKVFIKNGLIHAALDGSGTAKYALCADHCEGHEHHHDHAHFTCTNCQTTTCIEGKVSMDLKLPKGFSLAKSTLVLEGFCSNC